MNRYLLKIYILVFSISIFMFSNAFGAADSVRFSVGTARMDITPDARVKNWVTGKPYEGITDSLSVSAIVLSDGENKVVMVSWDLVDAGESATDEVRKRVSSKLDIDKANIWVSGTHNHSAPWSPVYNEGYRGKERDTWWAIRYMPEQNEDPFFKKWMEYLMDQTLKAVTVANESLQETTVWIGRADASEFMNNRRPRAPQWGVAEDNTPKGYGYKHEAWNPKVLPGGFSYGPLDRTLSLVSFRDDKGNNIVSFFNTAIHAVSIYPYSNAISSDWPGEAAKKIGARIGGQAVFFQGAAGDVNPWKRGSQAVKEMGEGIADLAEAAFQYSVRLTNSELRVYTAKIGLPLNENGKERTGMDHVDAEVKLITMGPLAFVSLPGEPLTDLGKSIREHSSFPQTIVLGYSNGNGVHYVGMPCEQKFGGYEMTMGTVGEKEAGIMLVETANRLLDQAYEDVKK